MYVRAPRWRGTSPVSRPLSARQVRGFGAVDSSCQVVGTDPANGSPIVHCDSTDVSVNVPIDGGPVSYFSTSTGQPVRPLNLGPASGGGLTDWFNANAGTVALAGGGLLAVLLLVKVAGR